MRKGTFLTTALIAASALAMASSANAAGAGVRVGTLTCNVQPAWGHVVASSRDVDCTYQRANHNSEHYTGEIDRYGVDVGHTRGGTLVWAVVAPSSNVGRTALEGSYGGVSADATVGVGGAAHILVGGLDR
ncbi:MAG TPA: DUF992 domain-containing protein, partial [Caulobacterales bacterium]|nr:DUF992 domain-containing protein [Caulobacterales bacterium]